MNSDQPIHNTEDIAVICYDFTDLFYQRVMENKLISSQPDQWKQSLRKESFDVIARYVLNHDQYPALGLGLVCKVFSDTLNGAKDLKQFTEAREKLIHWVKYVVEQPEFINKAHQLFTYEKKPFDLKEIQNGILYTCLAYFNEGQWNTKNLGGGNLSSEADHKNGKTLRKFAQEITEQFRKDLSVQPFVDKLQQLVDHASEYTQSMHQSMTNSFVSSIPKKSVLSNLSDHVVMVEDEADGHDEEAPARVDPAAVARRRAERDEELAQPTRTSQRML